MGVQFPGKKRYVTLEWPLSLSDVLLINLHYVAGLNVFLLINVENEQLCEVSIN